MTIKFSTGLRDALVPFLARPGYLHLYNGGQPPSVTDAPQGTRLCPPISLVRSDVVGGAQQLTSSSDVVVATTGVATWGRIVSTYAATDTADANADSMCDFTVGTVGSDADVILAETALTAGDLFGVSLMFTQSAT